MLGVRLISLAFTMIVVTTAGCGGPSNTSSNDTRARRGTTAAQTTTASSSRLPTTGIPLAIGKPLSRATWMKKAEAICARTNTKVSSSAIPSATEYATALPQLALYVQREARELSKLVPPPAVANDWTKIVDGLWLDGQYVRQAGYYFKVGNHSASGPAVIRANNLHELINRVAKRHGFTECAVSRVRRNSPTGR